MAGKKVFMLRITPEVYEALEQWAADEFRSVNGQVEWIIEKALSGAGRNPKKRSGTLSTGASTQPEDDAETQ
jgi:hypothetical protein